jgi:hypothetical protein
MEGTLLVPPDRGTIIGRALWKVGMLFIGHTEQTLTLPQTRFVVIGGAQREQQSDSSFSQGFGSSISGSAPRVLPRGTPDSIYLAIYKSKVHDSGAEPQCCKNQARC